MQMIRAVCCFPKCIPGHVKASPRYCRGAAAGTKIGKAVIRFVAGARAKENVVATTPDVHPERSQVIELSQLGVKRVPPRSSRHPGSGYGLLAFADILIILGSGLLAYALRRHLPGIG